MSLDDILGLPVGSIAAEHCHLWLWTTNQFLRSGFDCLEKWGFKYLAPIVWVKPSGCGNYFIHRTQILLFGYRGKLRMEKRYLPNVIEAPARRHSQKPDQAYQLIESVSGGPRVELFARQTRPGWSSVGNAIDGKDIREVEWKTT
jgi:N6-adenosine-specific RNA methylase IME4